MRNYKDELINNRLVHECILENPSGLCYNRFSQLIPWRYPMKFHIPQKVNDIIEELMKHGYEAYAVGGCVRDMILGRIPEDWDITTSATPQEVKKIFRRTVDTGIQHGTVTVLMEKEHFEVTTYRLDGVYEDNRHPKEVSFTSSLTEDLKRRDFTI